MMIEIHGTLHPFHTINQSEKGHNPVDFSPEAAHKDSSLGKKDSSPKKPFSEFTDLLIMNHLLPLFVPANKSTLNADVLIC